MKRGRVDIINEVLSAASEGIGKTALVYRTNLNFNMAEKYLDICFRVGFISVTRASPVVYRTTSKGTEFIKNYSNLKKIVDLP